ncbi:MAG: thioredoxin fold domain-containing protein [Ignavibacteria bacterium]|nr:thioredoxin fold domain-containing protein [Ignavibacteria bacterium]
MKSIFIFLITVFTALTVNYSFAEEVIFTKGTYQEVLNLAKEQNKTVMIDFITDWCKWCVETDRKVYTNQDVSAFANANQINWKIDAEKGEGPELAKKYSVKGFPTIVFVNSDGTEIDRIYGYVPAESFLTIMKDYNAGVNTFGSIQKLLEENPDDPVANYKMAEKITNNGLEGDVTVYLKKTISADPNNEKGYTDDAKFMLAYKNENPEELTLLIKEYPNSEKVKDGYISLASYYAEKEDYKKANEIYSEAFNKFGKNDPDIKQSCGDMLLTKAYKIMKNEKATKKDRKTGIKDLQECITYVKGSVNEASAYYVMSELYFQNKNIKKANECIDKAISIYDKKAYRDQKARINKLEAQK